MNQDVAAILTELRQNLGISRIPYGTAVAVDNIYEGFLFSLVVLTAAECGASVTYRDVSHREVSSLVFRTSPGRLYSRAHPYTHAHIELGNAPPLEIHLGVRVRGTSGVLHECDVLVLEEPRPTGVACKEKTPEADDACSRWNASTTCHRSR